MFKKQITTEVGFLIIVLLAGVLIAAIYFLSEGDREYMLNNEVGFSQNKERDTFMEDGIDCEEEFDFVYSFGVGSSILNTKDNTYSPDMCGEPVVEYKMVFTDSEKKRSL